VKVEWTDGEYAVLEGQVYNSLGYSPTRTGAMCCCGGADPLTRARTKRWAGHGTNQRVELTPRGTCSSCGTPKYVTVKVRDLKDLPSRTPAPPTRSVNPPRIKDWPATCPRCGRAESAIVLFSSMECRHGCFVRGAQ
jgi:hypothetical protein